jgi:L-seryl-tRNA(Ser) seleniumtransferase
MATRNSTRTRDGPAAPRPPSVERLLAAVRPRVGDGRDHAAVLAAAREIVAAERARLASVVEGRGGPEPRPIEALAEAVIARLDGYLDAGSGGLPRAINATGVILHTNLGRAPWPRAAIEAATRAAEGYSLLELDRPSGRRGPRFRLAEDHLVALTGAEDALVVNNNATAIALAVGLAGRSGVAVSRGELVEIGGGVRIPEVIRRAGPRLIEVGTTNRTRVDDFREPLASGRARVVLRVHPSNYRQAGFVEAPDPGSLARLAHEHGALLVDDLGSGALLATERFGLAHEPTPAEALEAGADVVTFSGDKLIGGPQAGLIVGRAELIARLRKDPLARATRPDKVILAGLAATLGLYRAGLAIEQVPVWRMVAMPLETLKARAVAIVDALQPLLPEARTRVLEMEATMGGGSLPEEALPSVGVAVEGIPASGLMARLRAGDPAVVGRVASGAVLLDLRSVDPADDPALIAGVIGAASEPGAATEPGVGRGTAPA